MIERNLTTRGSVDDGHFELTDNHHFICDFAKMNRRSCRHAIAVREKRDRKSAEVVIGSTEMIVVGENNAGHGIFSKQLSKSGFFQLDRIDQENSILCGDSCGEKIGLHRAVVTVPDGKTWLD